MNTAQLHLYGRNILLWFFGIGLAGVLLLVLLYGGKTVKAVPGELTVCASGCDHTTIGDAFTAANGDGGITTISVQSTYDASGDFGEVFPREGLTLSCELGATIGTGGAPDQLTVISSSTIQNCTFSKVNIIGMSVSNVVIDNNTFATSTFSKISIGSMTSSTISNNSGFQYFAGSFASGTFSGNTIPIYSATDISSFPLDFDPITNSTITGNTITAYDRAISSKALVYFKNGSYGITFTSNTLSTAVTENMGDDYTFVTYSGSGTASDITLQNNVFSFEDFTAGSEVCRGLNVEGTSAVSLIVSNNTFSWYDSCVGILFNPGAGGAITVTSTYNIFYNGGAAETGTGHKLSDFAGGNLTLSNNYNGYYAVSSEVGGAGLTVDTNYKTSNPYFKTANASASDDWELAPFSDYLDVFSTTNDIGARSGTRGSSFVIDDDGIVDYSSIHSTSTAPISIARSGDTFSISAGTYNEAISLTQDNVTISGADSATTIINGDSSTSTYSFNVSGSTSTISGLTVNQSLATSSIFISGSSNTISDVISQNASTTVNTYSATVFTLSYNGTDYTGGTYLFRPGCDLLDMADTIDVTNHIASPMENYHVAAVDAVAAGAGYVSLLVPNQYATSSEALNAACGGIGLNTDLFISDILVAASSAFTYQEEVLISSGATNTGSISIQNVSTGDAGFYISGSSNLLETVTSTVNGYGIWFSGSSSNNVVSSSIFTTSGISDIYSDSSANNSIKNTSFTRSNSSIDGTGNVDVYFKSRGYVTNPSAEAVSGTAVTFTSADESQTSTVTTTIMGYTPYTDYLLAFTMTSSSIAVSNGGYNPYTVSTGELAGYQSTSTVVNVSSQNQTVSLTMLPTVPTAPTDIEFINISINSMKVGWTDASSNEDNFIFDYIQSTDVADFPGTTSSLDADVTSSTASGLTPNSAYMFRVAATNGGGTSAYVTSSARYTTPNSPTKPTATATGQTTVSLVWTANNNPDGTVYQIYNVTTDAAFATTTATSTTVTGLTANTSYIFEIRALWVENSATYSASPDSDSVTTDVAASGSNNSGGGGGTSYLEPVKPSLPTPGGGGSLGPKTIYTLYLKKPDTFFALGQTHHVELTSINTTQATIVISSKPQTIVLTKNQEISLNLDEKNPKDVYVRLLSLDEKNGTATVELIALETLPLVINDHLGTTHNKNVSVRINATNVTQFALSESQLFVGASFVPFVSETSYLLSEVAGKKTVYAKLRSLQGGEKVVSKDIVYQPQQASCPLSVQKAYKALGSSAVYYVDESSDQLDNTCTKRPFVRSQIFFTYFDSWSDVQVVPQATLDSISNDSLGFMPWGPKFDPKYGALVKTVNDPKVYLLLGTEKYWITSEDVFVALGYRWNWIEDVDVRLLDTYTNGSEISYIDHHPNYTLVKYANSSKVYRLEPNPTNTREQVKRYIVNEAVFISLDFRWDRIVTIAETEQYPEGVPLQ